MVMRKGICLAVLLCLSSVSAFATVKSQVSQTVINQGESIRLTIDLAGKDADSVDLSSLEGKFDILQRGQQSGITIINGDYQRTSELILVLLPKQSGDVTVPALTVDGDTTAPHAIRVSKVDLPAASEGGIELDARLSTQTPRVQQPIIYTASLLLGQQVYNGSIEQPKVTQGKALIEALGDQTKSQKYVDGQVVTVVEQSWLITPEQSGVLSIEGASLIGQIPVQGTTNRTFNSRYIDPSNLRRFQLSADSYELDVAGIPADFTGATWLPSSSVVLEESWSSDEFRVGEPVTRTITLTANGLTSNQLSSLVLPDAAGLKQYAGTPQLEQTFTDGKLSSTMSVEVTLIPSQEGTLELPALQIPWWNVTSDTEEVASLAARKMTVAKGNSITQSVVQQNNSTQTTPLPETEGTQPTEPKSTDSTAVLVEPSPNPPSSWVDYWWLAVIAGVLGSLVTVLCIRLFPRQQLPANESLSRSTTLSNAHTGNTDASKRAIKDACLANDVGATRHALIAWGQQVWPDCRNLNQLMRRVSPELKIAIAELQRQAYSQSTSTASASQANHQWQGSELWDVIKSYQPDADTQSRSTLVPLSPLHST
ncbi:BatD family protein [Neptunomonas phycophila]|uniref:BatD family protein n=1 Tax=Neptunomonas phycophila TaxID=1572645 RepID=UPI0026E2198A|nr:BatD family protein [Neptunomonas phycophila]MDO6785067.1 BatD family protein [Neptunomonas phycophila]